MKEAQWLYYRYKITCIFCVMAPKAYPSTNIFAKMAILFSTS